MSSIFSKFSQTTKSPAPAANPVLNPDSVPVTPILDTAPVTSAQTDHEPTPITQALKKPKVNLNLKNFMSSKMALLGIFGFIMLVMAISLQIAARSRSNQDQQETEIVEELGPDITGTDTITTDWSLYQDPYNSYTIKYPKAWNPENSSVESTKIFGLPDEVKLEINISSTKASNTEAYLEDLDASRSTAWEGRPSRKVNKTTPIRIGRYDGFERVELVSAAGVEYLIAYIMVDEDVFRFSLIPGGKETGINNQELVRQFRLALTTFDITNKAERLGEWKTYSSEKIEGLSYPGFNISFPATWAINEKKEATGSGNLVVTISRNGYKIGIVQIAAGGAVCLFKDSPSYEGSSGDLRSKEFTELTTDVGYVLRRYYNSTSGDNTIFYFCGKSDPDQYFATPTSIGGLSYTVPAKYDPGVIQEMDNIIKTIQAR